MNNQRKIWNDIFQLSQAVFRVTHLFPKDEILKRHLREKITEILYQSSPNFAFKNDQNLIKEIHDFRGLLFVTKNCNFVDDKNLEILIKGCVNLIESLDLKRQENFSQRDLISGIQDTEPRVFYQPQDEVQSQTLKSLNLETFMDSTRQSRLRQSRVSPKSLSGKQESDFFQVPNPKSQTSNQSEIGFSILNSRQQKILDYFQKTTEEKNRLKDISKELKFIHPRTLRQDLKYLCDNGHLIRDGFGPGSFYSFIRK